MIIGYLDNNQRNISTDEQRVYGFLAERLMGVFIAIHKDLKVKQVPMIFVEEDKKKYRKYKFRQIKRKILSLIGIKKYRTNK